ncbi:uncharacterized protein LOC129594093 isoform X2 [Paramacrobiotus metropolitanus]|uniref:uncharacterized protein LOC129594093 isoform X2 n=1 Tax=Paramacrobiotus metropolitanus TaxID=2943436 RepID=UPI00244640FD|nr:uncharacterized protein LOC129594093 isoform X2 [Paramacrobiotus metropolitanus]
MRLPSPLSHAATAGNYLSWINYLLFCQITFINAQFFIPNPSTQMDQFQSPDSRFVDTRLPHPNGPPPSLPDGFGSSAGMPTGQQADQPFSNAGPNPPSASSSQFADAAPTPLPKHLQPPPDFVCEETFGHYGDVMNCSRFFVCVFGIPVVQECSKGLHYNAQLGLCDWPKNTECPGKGNGFFAIPGTTTEAPVARGATIPWWLQGEDAAPSRGAPERQPPPAPASQPSFHDAPLFERQAPRPTNASELMQGPLFGPPFPTGSFTTTRRPWWNPWQPNGLNNDTWPPHAQPSAQSPLGTTTPKGQPDFQNLPTPFQVQQDFAKFQQASQLAQQQQMAAAAAEREARPNLFGRPDLTAQLNPSMDPLSNRELQLAQGGRQSEINARGQTDLGSRQQEMNSRQQEMNSRQQEINSRQQEIASRQELLFGNGIRPNFFPESFNRPDMAADAKPSRNPAAANANSKSKSSETTGNQADLFAGNRAPVRPDQLEQMFGFPFIRPTGTAQANDGPTSSREISQSNQFSPFGRLPQQGLTPSSGNTPSPFGGQFPPQNQLGFHGDSPFFGAAGFPQFGADRFETTTTPSPRSPSAQGSSGTGQSRPDFTGQLSGSRPDNFNPNRLLDFGAHPARPDLIGVTANRPDFGARFPISGLADDVQQQQPQQNARTPTGNFPFPGFSSRPERPSLSADIPPGFIPGGGSQLSQERLQQLAHERMQQMARFPPDQLGILGFGSDRFAADQPSNQPTPQQNAGIIRPSDRINGGQANNDRKNQDDMPNTSGFIPRGNQPFQQNPPFHDNQAHETELTQFGQTTRGPFWQQPEMRADGRTTNLPFWMQGSVNADSNVPPFPMNVFRTDSPRMPPPGGILPQPRILQNNFGRPAEMTTHPANILDFETTFAIGQANDVTESLSSPVTSDTPRREVTTTPFPINVTTARMPWWLQDTTNGSMPILMASASSRVSQSVPNLGRNPSMFAKFAKPAEALACERQTCKLPDCWCGGTEIPGGLPVGETPQMIMLTFDDAVTNQNYHLYTSIFSENRRNPNTCPIRGTFYVSHEWSEYFLVQNLYSDGHEIGSHSVTHTLPGKNFTKNDWADEISGQREILHRFGNVKAEDVKGMRAPYLQTGGNSQFEMLWEKGFLYDSSMSVAENNPPMWPYTLDYALPHKCWIPPCPTKSYPGLWEVPLVHWEDLLGYRCAMADACHNPGDADEVYQLLMNNFKRHYETNRAPFGMYYHSAWFIHNYHMEGFKKFLDTVLSMPDVWVVSASQVIQWIQNPTPLSVINQFEPWSCNNLNRPSHCNKPNVCPTFFRGGMRYIRTCEACPESYPWIKNTHGASRNTQPNTVPSPNNAV